MASGGSADAAAARGVGLHARIAPAAAPTATPTTTPTAAPTATPTAAPTAAPKVPVRLTDRVKAGRELYAKLKQVGELSHDRKSKAAAEVLASLHPPPAPTDLAAEARQGGVARQRVLELRDFVFSFGGLSLTRQILARLLNMREIKLLLPDELQQRQRDADDGETAREVLRAAKSFFGEIMKSKGRRSDIQRNAFVAGLVALLPRDLFENRRGRAAMRLLGLSYRQAKLGSGERAVLEDCGQGWRLWKGGTRKDKVNWRALDAAWHSSLLSDPDNQHKEKFMIDLGIDPTTKEQLYDHHPRRAQRGSTKSLLPIFRESPFMSQLKADNPDARGVVCLNLPPPTRLTPHPLTITSECNLNTNR